MSFADAQLAGLRLLRVSEAETCPTNCLKLPEIESDDAAKSCL